VMNHIAKRRSFDKKNIGHDSLAAPIYRSLSMTAISMPPRHAIRVWFFYEHSAHSPDYEGFWE